MIQFNKLIKISEWGSNSEILRIKSHQIVSRKAYKKSKISNIMSKEAEDLILSESYLILIIAFSEEFWY